MRDHISLSYCIRLKLGLEKMSGFIIKTEILNPDILEELITYRLQLSYH